MMVALLLPKSDHLSAWVVSLLNTPGNAFGCCVLEVRLCILLIACLPVLANFRSKSSKPRRLAMANDCRVSGR